VRRNLKQVSEVLKEAKQAGTEHLHILWKQLKVAERIFEQQLTMYQEKSYRIKNRIVSFHRPWVRPIKRGKNGKDIEFGAKCAMSHVDGILFLDAMNHDNFSEAQVEVV